jgi:hypothetical protein
MLKLVEYNSTYFLLLLVTKFGALCQALGTGVRGRNKADSKNLEIKPREDMVIVGGMSNNDRGSFLRNGFGVPLVLVPTHLFLDGIMGMKIERGRHKHVCKV